MAIHGVSKEPVPYVPEIERAVTKDQSVFWIQPKTGHAANRTMARYAMAGKEGRKGYRELSVAKLDNADVLEFLDTVVKVENYYFSDSYPDLKKQKLFKEITDQETLRIVCLDMPADLLIELMEASNNMATLEAGSKKASSSQSTSLSGKAKVETD